MGGQDWSDVWRSLVKDLSHSEESASDALGGVCIICIGVAAGPDVRIELSSIC